ncbi:FAD-dependent oxidoreductase [Candidatus Gracilibacteria bacterium]|nr:FAD-dependent oxidoreductase [Candidatus Gracilibacteria bacterium]
MPTLTHIYHTIVIGSGSGGLTVALGLASAGNEVLMIERGLIGGDCTNYGCIPSKALIHAEGDINDSLHSARHIRDEFRHEETQENFEKKYPYLTIIKGTAVFVDIHTIDVGGVQYTGKNIVIATGSDPRLMEIVGVPPEHIFSNRTIFDVENIDTLVIVGGGYIAIEMAFAFARRGVSVTMLVRSDRLSSGVNDEFTQAMLLTLENIGVDIRFNTSIESGNEKELILKNTSSGQQIPPIFEITKNTIPYSHILLALGRVANIEGLDLKKVGINFDTGGIITDSYGRTNYKNIFALGDVVSGNRQFTHLANHEGRGIIQSLLFPYWKKKIKNPNIPSVLYDREVEFARTGLTSDEAIEKYGADAIITDRMDFTSNDRSRTESDTTGYIRIIARRLSLQIVGAEIVGKGAGEIVSTLTLAIDNGISLYKLRSTIIPYPTRSDLMKRLSDRIVIATLRNIGAELRWWIVRHIPLFIGIIIWASIVGAFLYFKHASGKDNVMLIKDLYYFITKTTYGPLVYIIFYAIRPVIFFPATLLTFLSGLLFGVWGGFIYTMIGENMSASVAYFIGRFFGSHIPELRKSPITLDSERTFSSILFTRFAFFPFDIVNYLSGFLRLPWLPFALATLIGIIPGALVFIIAGSSVQGIENFSLSGIRIDPMTLVYSVILFVISILFARYLKNRTTKQFTPKK